MQALPRVIARRPLSAQDGGSGVFPANLHPVLARVYRGRQVRQAGELDHSLTRLEPPGGMKDMARATALLQAALAANQRLLVVADFDADGATSCALVVRGLRALGARDVDYVVPDRFKYGYGLTPEIVALAAQRQPDLLITVDNGISSVEGVRAARRHGIEVIITDHHLPGAELPEAAAIVNPNQPGDGFPSKHLAGVGVAFYLLLALRARLRDAGWFAKTHVAEPNLARFLDLVALGTVADVVPLDHNNRILVAQGLGRVNAGQACAGIEALARVAGRVSARLTATDLGFLIAPRLNAAGRLDDMSLGIECLLADDPQAAAHMARQLDQLNRERRSIERDMQEQADETIAALHLDGGGLPHGLCLFDESWHQGVIGLLAARVKERVHRPVIAFAPANTDELKGSARSVAGVHIRDALDAVAGRHPDLLRKFGGHAMAAGLTLARRHLPAFRAAFAEEIGRWLNDDDLQGKIWSDGELAATELNLDLAEKLRAGGPWGQGFPEPVFDGDFDVIAERVVGEKHLKLALRPPRTDATVDAIAFNAAPDGEPLGHARVRAAYRLDVNEYRGARRVQMIVEHLEPM